MSDPRKAQRPLLAAVLLGVGAVAAAFFFKPLPALEDRALLASSPSVSVARQRAGILFAPAAAAKATGLVVYCGDRAPPEAYAYLARACAEAGYPAFLAAMPLNFASLAPARAAEVASYPGVARWAIAGHDRGGAAASSFVASNYASKEPMAVAGLILYASCPGRGVDLSTKSLAVVTVGASLDTIVPPAEIAASRERLPAGSRYAEIAGGNHAQFGEYGPQPGDGPAEIPGPIQRKAAVDEALALLDRLDAGVGN
jgi:hypothetical protein